jgi:hypothetical protein
MRATENPTTNFCTVPDHAALAVLADRRYRLDRAFEAVECMTNARGDQLK